MFYIIFLQKFDGVEEQYPKKIEDLEEAREIAFNELLSKEEVEGFYIAKCEPILFAIA